MLRNPRTKRAERALRQAGALLRERRTGASLSQRQVAEQLGVTQSTVSHAERGLGTPELTLAALRVVGSVPRATSAALRRAMR